MMKARAESWKRVPVKAAGVEVAASSLGEGRGSTTASGAPAIILVKPQLGENIGFAARAMANFGLTDLQAGRAARWLAEREGARRRRRRGLRGRAGAHLSERSSGDRRAQLTCSQRRRGRARW